MGVFLSSQSLLFSETMQLYSVAFVDWNNYEWLDIFFISFNKSNHVYLNQKGVFDQNTIKIPNYEVVLMVSPIFGDLDLNGYPDVYNANMALGIIKGFAYYRGVRETP